ncbi:dihydrofolate reductase family protein [Ruania zhangjianzhongii]|uniref:dihydrofolate reductase family protein n=1 Tax=Ruania zhangjianzhongii TaxID=2603206 RepID=UPI0011D1FC6E|nr:dihydrofolate reductase family protein [Ruania zhangjianzhongii]
MKIAISQFLSLDGVSQGPGAADEDTTDGFSRGGWFVPYLDADLVHQTSLWLDHADGLLLGRRTYEAFARDWPQITDPGDPFTARMNSLPKYVVSTTLTEGVWSPTTVLGGDPVRAVSELKEQPGRELQVHGSARLAATLLAAGLVDVVRLALAPTLVGTGRVLFPQLPSAVGLELTEQSRTASGLLLEYQVTGAAPVQDYAGVTGLA